MARELGIQRETVGRHLRPKPAKVTTGSARARSSCEPWREMIEEASDPKVPEV